MRTLANLSKLSDADRQVLMQRVARGTVSEPELLVRYEVTVRYLEEQMRLLSHLTTTPEGRHGELQEAREAEEEAE